MRTIKFRELHTGQVPIYRGMNNVRRAVLRCGRRFGKSELLETRYARKALTGRKVGWFTDDYKRLRPSYTRMRSLLLPALARSSKTELLLQLLNGGLIEFWSLEDEDAGRSRDYDDVVVDEAGLIVKGLRERVELSIEPTLLDRGGTLTLAGTPKGINPESFFYVACTDKTLGYEEFYAPTRDNPFLNAGEVASLPTKFAPLVYQQEYLAQWVSWQGTFFLLEKLLHHGEAVNYPHICDAVLAVIDTATKTGKENDGTGVVYLAYSRINYGGFPVVILDWELKQIEGADLEVWLPGVFTRLEELAVQCHAREGSVGVWIEDKASGTILLQQAQKRNWKARSIDSKLTAMGKVERAINVSGHVHQDKIKLSHVAHDKVISYKGISRNHLESQVIGFSVGVKDQVDDDLLDCFSYLGAITLGNADGF